MNTIPSILSSSIPDVPVPAAAVPGLVDVGPRIVITGATPPVSFLPPSRVWDATQIIVGSVAPDWITLTTFDAPLFEWAVALIGKLSPDEGRKAGRWLQYEGSRGEGYFYGSAYQHKKGHGDYRLHYALTVSGSFAYAFLVNALGSPSGKNYLSLFRCTRFDVQYTHFEPLLLDTNYLYSVRSHLRDGTTVWPNHRGNKPKTQVILNDDGLDTLYIGERKETVRLHRIYVKDVPDPQTGELQQLTRWETEFKQELSLQLWSRVVSEGLSILPSILMGEVSAVPLPDALSPLVAGISAAPDRLRLRRVKNDLDRTLAWFEQIMRSTARRLLAAGGLYRSAAASVIEEVYLGDELARYLGPSRQVGDFVPILV